MLTLYILIGFFNVLYTGNHGVVEWIVDQLVDVAL
jgi:hypothetical protein